MYAYKYAATAVTCIIKIHMNSSILEMKVIFNHIPCELTQAQY